MLSTALAVVFAGSLAGASALILVDGDPYALQRMPEPRSTTIWAGSRHNPATPGYVRPDIYYHGGITYEVDRHMPRMVPAPASTHRYVPRRHRGSRGVVIDRPHPFWVEQLQGKRY